MSLKIRKTGHYSPLGQRDGSCHAEQVHLSGAARFRVREPGHWGRVSARCRKVDSGVTKPDVPRQASCQVKDRQLDGDQAHGALTTEGFPVLYPVAVTWMRQRDHNIFASAASLLICGVLAGVVVAAAAFPAIAMGGLAMKASADGFGELPTELDTRRRLRRSRTSTSDACSGDVLRREPPRHQARGRTADHAGCHPRGGTRSSTSTRAWTCRASCGPSSPIRARPRRAPRR